MQKRKSLVELAGEIERQQSSKKDMIADTRSIRVVPNTASNKALRIELRTADRNDDQGFSHSSAEGYNLQPTAIKQITERVKIPARYANRMAEEAPELLAHNMNHWFKANPERRMIRTLDGNARAFLSDRYQRIDNVDIASVVLPILAQDDRIKIKSCEITDKRMYIQAVTDRIHGEVTVGDEVQAGIIISNSEIGYGAVSIQPLIYRLVCDNGMILPDQRFRKNHVGARADAGEDVYTMLTDEALKADDTAIMLKIRDVVSGAMDQIHFDKALVRMRQAAEAKITGDPVKAMEVLTETMTLSQHESGAVLTSLIEGGDLSKWGFVNALTAQANTVEDYDRAVELSTAGGKLLDLPQDQWQRISEAA